MKNVIKFSAPLRPNDTEEQTDGCRNNPEICSFYGIDSVCALVREDNICYKPSKAWAKQYAKLKSNESQ